MDVNWSLIAHLPADGEIYDGGAEYGAYRVRHTPATKFQLEQIFAETSEGLQRRILEFRKGKPQTWSKVQYVSGRIAD